MSENMESIQILQKECTIDKYCHSNHDWWSTSVDWYHEWQNFFSAHEPLPKNILYIFKIPNVGVGTKMRLNCRIAIDYEGEYSELGENPCLSFYVLSSIPEKPYRVPDKSLTIKQVPIVPGATNASDGRAYHTYDVSIDGFRANKTDDLYLALTATYDSDSSIRYYLESNVVLFSEYENLIPLFTGNPSWYIRGGQGTIGDSVTVTTNYDGSFTINGQTDSATPGVAYRRFYFHVLRHGTSTETDLHLSRGIYKLTYECNGVEVHNGDSTAVAVYACSFPSDSEYDAILDRANDGTIVVDSSVSGDVFLEFDLAPGNTFNDFNVKATLAFVSAVLPPKNLIPKFTRHPSWYVSGGSETLSGDCTITANSDGSFTLNGTTGSTDTTFNLLRIASGMSDLHLSNGTYEYYVKMPMNHHVTEIGPTVDSYSASTGSLVRVVSLAWCPKKYFDITSEYTGEIELSFTLPKDTSYDNLTFSLYLGEKSGVDPIIDLETAEPHANNLFRYLAGHPDWYVQGGQTTIGSSCTVTVNDNGSITLNGIIDQDPSDPFLVGAVIRGGDDSVDLKLRSREYAFILETNQPNNLNDLEAYLHVDYVQVHSGEHFDPSPGGTSGSIPCYLFISFTAGVSFDNLILRPYVYAVEDYENLIPLFPGDPTWYSYRGTASLSDIIGAETLDDSSIVLQGNNGNEFTVPSVALLRKTGTSQTDLHLTPGTYKFFIREFDRKKWSTYTGYDDGTINATLYSFSSDGSGTMVELCQNYSSFEITSGVTGDVFVIVDFSEYTPYYYDGPGGSSYKTYKRFEPVICDNSYRFPTDFVPWDNTGNLFPQFSGYPDWYVVGGTYNRTSDTPGYYWNTEVQSDGSFITSGFSAGTSYQNFQILKKGDLVLTPGSYQYKVKFDGTVNFTSNNPQMFFELISVEDNTFGTDVATRIELSSVVSEVVHNFDVSANVNVAFRFFTHDTISYDNFRFKPYIYRAGSTGGNDQGPVITTQPQSITVAAGHTATFSITATGSNLSYNWAWYNGTKWVSLGHTTSSFSFTAGSTMNGIQYHCIVTDGNGNFVVSNPATLTVTSSSQSQPPVITSQPQSVTVVAGNTATFALGASGSNLSYNWQVSTDNGLTWASLGQTTSSMSFTTALNQNGYKYQCIVTDGDGKYAISNIVTLTVASSSQSQSSVITSQPQSITVLTGNTATFSVTASGSNLSYSWEVSTDNGATWTSLGWTMSSISFTAALSQNGYRYRCVVTENGNSTISNSATLFVTSGSGSNDNPSDPSGNNQGNTTPIVNPGGSASNHVELSSLYTGTQSYTFPEDYFSSGRIYWRVRSYDSDGNPGEWSESATFICYGVSRVQELQCDGKPFATISWVANGQVSYEIKIDDSIGYGPFHGTDGRFVLAEPLEDGHHKVSVRVQNNLGLESPWDEIEFDVQNIPSDDTTSQFVVQADVDASLWWTPPSIREEDEFLVYRDNKLIRRFESSVTSFSDRVVLGYHTYKVIQHLPSGYYNLYTHPEVFLTTDITKIGLLNGGPWLNLTFTTDRYPTNTFKQTRIVERTRIMGSKYPVVEISDFEELSATYEVVWPYEKREAAYQFKKLLGKAVIVKSRGEQVVVGVLDGYELPVNSQTVGYSFTIEQMDFDDDASIAIYPEGGFDFYTDLDKIAFGLMNKMDLESVSTNPGTSNPQYYEQIAEAINELKRTIAVLQSEATTNG